MWVDIVNIVIWYLVEDIKFFNIVEDIFLFIIICGKNYLKEDKIFYM